jgi:hypothetical protein
MTRKLNLTIEEETARKIKAYAARNKTSVSKIAEEYFGRLTEENSKKKKKSFVEEWAGIATQPIGDIEKVRDEYLREKYGE